MYISMINSVFSLDAVRSDGLFTLTFMDYLIRRLNLALQTNSQQSSQEINREERYRLSSLLSQDLLLFD